jgi:hypothetical protein
MDSTKHCIGHQMAEHVADRNGGRVLRVQDAIFRSNHLEGKKRCVIVRDFWRNRAFQAVTGIGS